MRSTKKTRRKMYLIVIVLIAVAISMVAVYSIYQLHQAPSGEPSQEVSLAEPYIKGDWTFACNAEFCDIVIRVFNGGNMSIELYALSIIAVFEKGPEPIGSVVINETVKPGEEKVVYRQVSGILAEKLKQVLNYILEGRSVSVYAHLGTSIGKVLLELLHVPI